MIKCDHLSKIFYKNTGISDVNITFNPGIIYGIIGYNGAGKTTLLRCIEGLYRPTKGAVYHNEIITTHEKDFLQYRKNIAFLPTEEYLYKKLTCIENIEYATILRTGKNKILNETEKLIKYFEVDVFLNQKFENCSTGMKKKVQIIISLIGNIETIIWDEPNDGLDIVSNMKIKKLLEYYRSKNKTILFSCHVIEFLENFIDHCILIQNGKIMESVKMDNKISLNELYLKYIDKNSISIPFNNE